MRFLALIVFLTMMIPGCERQPGNGLWNLKVGGEAKLVSSDGSEITLETFGAPAQGKTSRRLPKTSKVEQIKVSAGTTVLVLAIDGDDARVEIKDGPRTGSIYWVECARLESLVK
jgi:hypothetical protein